MAQNDRTTGQVGNAGCKVPVRAASTIALVLSGEQTVDGVVLVTDDRILVKNQASSIDNGIYVVDTGAWSRSKDCDGTLDLVKGSVVLVNSGTVNAGLFYRCTSADPIDFDTDAITWTVCNPGTAITVPVPVAQGGTGQDTASEGATLFGVVQLGGAGGTANAQTASAPSNYANAANNLLEHTPSVTNTAATTLTITPQGGAAQAARSIFYDGAALTGSELVANVPTILFDDGARLHIVGYSRKVRSTSLGHQSGLINGTIVQTRAGSAETIAVKTLAGADPSAADPVGVIFRNATAATGDYTVLWLTAALSLTISSGSTMGVGANSTAFRLWYAIFNDAGTARLAAINCLTTSANAGSGRNADIIYPLSAWGIASSTAEGGAGAADSAQTFYTGVAAAAKAFSVIGYATWEAGLAAIGTWGTAPTRIQLFAQGVPLPGTLIQRQRNSTGADTTGGATIPQDDTIPQIGEGIQYLTQAITPSSGANALRVVTNITVTHANAVKSMTAALFQDAIANALGCTRVTSDNGWGAGLQVELSVLAGLVVSTTFRLRAGTEDGTAIDMNGSASSRLFGGAMASWLCAEEVMA